MATADSTKHDQHTDNSDSVAALRFLSAVAGKMEGVVLTSEESQFRKKADGTLSPFLTDEDEASYRSWTAENKERIAAMKTTSREALEFMWCMTEWQYERVNKAWDDALDLVSTMRETLTIKDEVMRTERLVALLESWDKIRAGEKQRAVLDEGRKQGAKSQKKRAAESLAIMKKINSDLLKHPDWARKGLDDRAGYIHTQLRNSGITQPNGKVYSPGTIKRKITGQG